MVLTYGPLFEEVESSTSSHGAGYLWGHRTVHTLSPCPFSSSFSSYPGSPSSPPKWLLAHLLLLKVPLSWPVLLRIYATNVHTLGLQGAKGGCWQSVGVTQVCRLGAHRLVYEVLCIVGKSQRWEKKGHMLGTDWFFLCRHIAK